MLAWRDMDSQLDATLAALRASVPEGTRVLDGSYASLDALEDWLATSSSAGALEWQAAAYLGTTLVQHAGGRWDVGRSGAELDEPCVTGLPEIPRARLFPGSVVRGFLRLRTPGHLRDTIERYDLPHRRAQLKAWVARTDLELDALRRDVSAHTGRELVLDDSPECVAAVERWLSDAIGPGVGRDERRMLRARVVLYLGAVVRRTLGEVPWTICSDPKDVDFGQLVIDRWCPMAVVRNVVPKAGSGVLQHNVSAMLQGRTTR